MSNGTVVNDRMKKLVAESVYEHPVHFFIIDCSDPIWIKYFSIQELTEIKIYKLKKLSVLPENLFFYLNSYESLQCTSDVQKFAFSYYNDPKDEFEKKWIQKSFINASKPFIYRNQLNFNDYSEADLLHKL